MRFDEVPSFPEKPRMLKKAFRTATCRISAVKLIVFHVLGGLLTLTAADGEDHSHRHLFLDDTIVESTHGLTRTLHQPEKRGAVIRSPNPQQTVQTRSCPVWDPEHHHYKIWVLGIDRPLWQSTDGLHWIPGPIPDMRTDHVVYDPETSDRSQRFKAALLNQGFAVSNDGVHWNKLSVPRIDSSDEGNLSFDPSEGLFIHTVKRGSKSGRALAVAVSRDFQNWTDHGLVFQTDEFDQEAGRKAIAARKADPTLEQCPYDSPDTYRVDIYNMGVFHYEGLYIGMPAIYHATGPVPNYPNTVGFHLVQLVCSHDLLNWKRVADRATFIGPSCRHSGAYDLTQILPPSAPLVMGEELWFYYTGLKYRGNWSYVGTYPDGEYVPVPGKDRDVGAVCLATLRRDGFVSLDAGTTEATLLTRPLALKSSQLFLNAQTFDGSIQITVLDESGQELAASDIISGDNTAFRVTWSVAELKLPDTKRVQLKFTMKNASIYSFW